MALKLSREGTISLIRMYGEYECLWNCRKKIYKETYMKREAWKAIANYFGTDVKEIKKKLKYLRTAYVAERRKLEESKRNSVNPSSVYQPRLFYYNDFNYLDNTVVLRKRELSDDDGDAGDREILPKEEASEASYDELSNDTNEQLHENESFWEKCAPEDYLDEDFKEPDVKKIKANSQENNNTITTVNSSEPSSKRNEQKRSPETSAGTDDMYLAFGKSVGLQLRNLKPINAAKAMAQIQETLTKYIVSEV
ncbi:uncharacterized protein LOC118748253 [Rhagoletis pomonella]|uniref:uncharacterized protein LOC118748253 n=1 Tax=Rhagoletis pomonella TaxID=28610 RepID=UPI001786F666|nr:uncharacterized protein LOC118748253 [Rhagoletis pomonella]